jgi:hypothetical protein
MNLKNRRAINHSKVSTSFFVGIIYSSPIDPVWTDCLTKTQVSASVNCIFSCRIPFYQIMSYESYTQELDKI